MRKKIPFLIAILLLLMAAGCGSKSAGEADSGQKSPAATEQSGSQTEQAAPPDNTPDVMGKVKTISGSKITVYKVNAPDRPSENGAKPPGDGAKPPQGERVRPEQPGELSQEERAQRRAEMFQVTDETIDLIVPDDTSIVQDKGFGENREINKIDLGSIQEGDLLRIWYGDKLSDGGQSVKYIQLLSVKE